MKRAQIQTRRILFDDVFQIVEARLSHELVDGTMSRQQRRLSFERGDSAAAVAIDADTGTILLVRQFRFPTYDKGPGWTVELVAGKVEAAESPESCIRREIREETACDVVALEPICTFYVSPGGSSERVFLFAARVRASQTAAHLGNPLEDEDIELVSYPLQALPSLIGAAVDAKTLIGLMWLQQHCEFWKRTSGA
jgi:nudix-type nucleoside diphosphatase (YffH/AdpP family)